MNDEDEFGLDEVERWDGVSPTPPDKIPVRGMLDELVCVRCVLEPQESGIAPQTFVCFKLPSTGTAYEKQIQQIIGAKSLNLWYQVGDDAATMKSVEDLDRLRSLEQILAMYEEEKKARMQ